MQRWPFAIGVASLLVSGVASADDKAECVAAASAAQDLRAARRLGEARDRLLVCARENCPAVVRRDCAQWFGEVESAMPTLVVSIKDERGVEVTDARVSLDGHPWLTTLDGKAVPVDPGVHVLRAELADAQPQESVTVREGEKNRVVSIVVRRTVTPPNRTETTEKTGTAPVLAAVLAGVGVVGLGVGTVFGLKTSGNWSDAKSACADGCSPGSSAYGLRDDARSAATISTVSFIAGGALVLTAAVLFFTSSSRTSDAPR